MFSLTDCVAEEPDQLMYIRNDHLIILRDLGNVLIASCEGVVGWVRRENLRFITLASGSANVSPILDKPQEDSLPITVLTAPSPPPTTSPHAIKSERDDALDTPFIEFKRSSDPFDLESESPQVSPALSLSSSGSNCQRLDGYFPPPRPPKSRFRQSPSPSVSGKRGDGDSEDRARKNSGTGSEAMGGIGRLMMDIAAREPSPDLLSASLPLDREESEYDSDRSWDIYGDYARESMYGPLMKIGERPPSSARGRESSLHRVAGWSNENEMEEENVKEKVVDALRSAQAVIAPEEVQEAKELKIDETTPKIPACPWPITPSAFNVIEEAPKNPVAESQPLEDASCVEAAQAPETAEPIEMAKSSSKCSSTNSYSIITPVSEKDDPHSSVCHDTMPIPTPAFIPPRHSNFPPSPSQSQSPFPSPSLDSPWMPGSPSSPHSIAATRSAVEASRDTRQMGRKSKGLTLVGRMNGDLSSAHGPVPIRFLVNKDGIPVAVPTPHGAQSPGAPGIGLGLPLPTQEKRVISPLASPVNIETSTMQTQIHPPAPCRSFTEPTTCTTSPKTSSSLSGHDTVQDKTPIRLMRPRSRSFSSSVTKTLGVGHNSSTSSALSINTSNRHGSFTPSLNLPQSNHKKLFKSSFGPSTTSLSPQSPHSPVYSASSSEFQGQGVALKGAVEHLKRKPTMGSVCSSSAYSSRALYDTDEWGFLKEKSPTPEIFQSRNAPGDHRAIESKWLSITSSPLPANGPPKKVRKLVLEAGIPNSLRGKVWAWFMAKALLARVPGLYHELLEHDKRSEDERIEQDVLAAYPDHSIFAEPNSPGQQDLRYILRAYSHFAPDGYRPEMALIAGAFLIHCVAEDSFWLLSGLVNSVLKDFYGKEKAGLKVEAAVFERLLSSSEPKLAKLFKEIELQPIEFMGKWFGQLFIRCLPWPTALRVVDAVDSLLLPAHFMKACEGVKYEEKEYRKIRNTVEKGRVPLAWMKEA
ncbi:rab GTPase activator [Cryptococcus deuterogattii 99/473]|uniref:Rab GTPase activator n=1 Tax=Cryptococcus deuterogattii Ram5 TaxID=1296110 RepID=A0A0D0V8X1_9TREE|nr:rab GTPase activator [Cryptococcus deuterogattii Ram5]KIY56270.1 rab GTPase activator [Cryptococcus deuterogattii 99/473]